MATVKNFSIYHTHSFLPIHAHPLPWLRREVFLAAGSLCARTKFLVEDYSRVAYLEAFDPAIPCP